MNLKLKTLAILFLIICVKLSAQDVTLNGIWHFKTDMYQRGVSQKWYALDTDYHHWDTMEVPGNWDIENEYAYYTGVAWYQRNFEIKQKLDKQYFIHFESVYNDSKVYLNGVLIGSNHLGLLPFELNVTKNLKNGKNLLVVQVNNSYKVGAIWNWGGIRQPVRLEIRNKIRLKKQFIDGNPISNFKKANIHTKIIIDNYTNEPRSLTVKQTIYRNDRKIVSKSNNVIISEGTGNSTSINMVLNHPDLWHFNYPNLYKSKIELYDGKTVLDTNTDNFGIRKIEVIGKHLKLNGKIIKPVGINLVQGDRIYGNTYPEHRIKEDVALLKSLGVQMARLSHLPLPKRFLDELDKNGIMIFEEVSVWGKSKLVDPDNPLPFEFLTRMIKEKYNHPSVIGWSVGNEMGYRSDNPKANEYVKKAIDSAHILSPNRLAVYVSHSAHAQKNDPAKYSDIVMINGYGNFIEKPKILGEKYPNKPIFFSELGTILNNENPDNSIIPIDNMYNQIRKHPNVIGVSLWTFNDYRSNWYGSSLWNTPKSENRSWGVVTTYRKKKKQFKELQRENLPFIFETKIDQKLFNIITKKRSINSFPYYGIEGYRLVVIQKNMNKEVLRKNYKISQDITLKILKETTSLEYLFLDSQGNTIYDNNYYFKKPTLPKILKVNSSSNSFRISYDKLSTAKSYYIKALSKEGKTIYSDSTTNNFIDLHKLKNGISYELTLIAVNEAGETESPAVVASTNEQELPPIIWDVKGINNSIMINYSVSNYDLSYLVRIGTSHGNYDKTMEFRNFGSIKIPDLVNGKKYYLQISRRMQYGFKSAWTSEITVTPNAKK